MPYLSYFKTKNSAKMHSGLADGHSLQGKGGRRSSFIYGEKQPWITAESAVILLQLPRNNATG